MILADTSIWVDHFRKRDIVAELVLGNLPRRRKTIADLDLLPMVKTARMSEVRSMVETRSLFQRGIGFVDVHLIASAFITPHTVLWSRDKRLREIASTLGVAADLA
jgi:predicted nucleic acid-binding protein